MKTILKMTFSIQRKVKPLTAVSRNGDKCDIEVFLSQEMFC